MSTWQLISYHSFIIDTTVLRLLSFDPTTCVFLCFIRTWTIMGIKDRKSPVWSQFSSSVNSGSCDGTCFFQSLLRPFIHPLLFLFYPFACLAVFIEVGTSGCGHDAPCLAKMSELSLSCIFACPSCSVSRSCSVSLTACSFSDGANYCFNNNR